MKLSLKNILKEVDENLKQRMKDYLNLISQESKKGFVSVKDAEALDPELFKRSWDLEFLVLDSSVPGLGYSQQKGVRVTDIAKNTYGILEGVDDFGKLDAHPEYKLGRREPVARSLKPLFAGKSTPGLTRSEDSYVDKKEFELIKTELDRVMSSLTPEDKQKLMRNFGVNEGTRGGFSPEVLRMSREEMIEAFIDNNVYSQEEVESMSDDQLRQTMQAWMSDFGQ